LPLAASPLTSMSNFRGSCGPIHIGLSAWSLYLQHNVSSLRVHRMMKLQVMHIVITRVAPNELR
jgi:hypothetical protein